ncbi:MAG TPA: ATP-binding protein, partial [Candidatus Limnocylindrales bacterium]|nr:ATP-binding protein [Candidatus Limnocylindrales bacterium]
MSISFSQAGDQNSTNTLNTAHALFNQFGVELDVDALAPPLVAALRTHFGSDVALLLANDRSGWSTMAAANETGAVPLVERTLWPGGFSPFLAALERREPAVTSQGDDAFTRDVNELAGAVPSVGLPLIAGNTLVGALLLSPAPSAADTEVICHAAAILLSNARRHTEAMQALHQRVRELDILGQIDRELSERLNLEHVLALTLDWAIRYTAAHAAFIALYDPHSDSLHLEAQLGYRSSDELGLRLARADESAALQAARSGRSQVISDLSASPTALPLLSRARTQLAVPVRHEHKVIAVLGIESRREGSLTDEQVRFIEQLGLRAGVAFENARLFAETEAEREKLAHILASIGDVVIVLNTASEIVLINAAAQAALQLPPGQTLAGRTAAQALGHTPVPGLLERFNGAAALPYVEVTMPDGRDYYAILSRHHAIGTIMVLHDLGPLKETEQLKNELLSTVSHDLKQPLTVMTGYLELLEMFQKLEPRSMHYVDMLQTAVRTMRMLIDDILNLARIESGVQIHAEPVRLDDLTARVFDELGPSARMTSITLQAHGLEAAPPMLADPGLAHTILSNLVGNSIKYTPPEGNVTVSAETRAGRLFVSVADTGIGVSPADQARIFDRFYRVRRPETQHIEGTGLGLSIVKRLVELHGGDISLHSELGTGSTFSF